MVVTGPQKVVDRVRLDGSRLWMEDGEERVTLRWTGTSLHGWSDSEKLRIVVTAPSVTRFDVEGSTAKPSLVWSASTLAALRVNGARAFHALIVGAKPMHIDLWLKAQVEQHTETLGCLCVNPPVGSYEEHLSGCEPTVGLRKSGFHEKWSRQGTRLAAGEQSGWYVSD